MIQQTNTAVTFGLLRHAETEWNVQKRIQGHGNSPLTPRGRLQATEWAKTLTTWTWHQIVSSDLGRVQETASIINDTLKLPITFTEALREQAWGDWEGLSIETIRRKYPDELDRRVAMGWSFAAPGGERRSAVTSRVLDYFTLLWEHNPGQNILVLCHQGVIKCVLYHLTMRQFLPGEDPLLQHNCFHLISCHNQKFATEQLNIPRIGQS